MSVRGWCPSIHEPMPTGDGLLVRVKPFGGRLPGVALRAVAEASERYGNGVIELTSRGNLQIRGLSEPNAPRFAAAMVDAGLADPDPARERRRNVITMPPYDDALAAEIEAVLMNSEGLAAKFCVAVGEADADITIRGSAGQRRMTAAGATAPYSADALQGAIAQAHGRRLKRSAPASIPVDADLMFLPYGRTDAAGLRRLAGLTDAARTTPYRAFYVPGSAPTGERAAIVACPGAPACASGSTPTRRDADFLAMNGIKNLHLSGCAKGCAYPRAGRTLVGRDGHYDLIRHGRAGDTPDLCGLTIAQAAAALA